MSVSIAVTEVPERRCILGGDLPELLLNGFFIGMRSLDRGSAEDRWWQLDGRNH